MSKSFVVWDVNGRYGYAWGSDEKDALSKYIANFVNGILKVVPAEEYLDALPHHLYITPPLNAVWDDAEPVLHQPLYDLGKPTTEVKPDEDN